MLQLILAVWIFLPLSEGQGRILPDCCDEGVDKVDGRILQIFEQKPGSACVKHFYIVTVEDGQTFCINPNSYWLRELQRHVVPWSRVTQHNSVTLMTLSTAQPPSDTPEPPPDTPEPPPDTPEPPPDTPEPPRDTPEPPPDTPEPPPDTSEPPPDTPEPPPDTPEPPPDTAQQDLNEIVLCLKS